VSSLGSVAVLYVQHGVHWLRPGAAVSWAVDRVRLDAGVCGTLLLWGEGSPAFGKA
jgi:hypothetical protein